MKSLYCAIIALLSSHLSHAMYVRTLVKLPTAAVHKPVPSVVVQKRNFSDCKCIEKELQKLNSEDKICWETIEKNVKMIDSALEIAKVCKDSLKDNEWAKSKKFNLEGELQSGKYCLNFSSCASKLELALEKRRASTGTSVFATTMTSLFALTVGDGFIPLAGGCVVWSMYNFARLDKLIKKEACLTKIAQRDTGNLLKFYENFARTLALQSADDKLSQEVQEKNKEQQDKE
jgi:hypothetical protein